MAVDHNNPQSRNEEILIAAIDGKEYNKLPQSRIEELLLELKEVIEAGSGGGGINPIGVTTTPLYDGATTNPIQINGESYTAETGDMVTYQSTEFLFNVNEVWQELGDVSVVLAIIDNIFADIAPAFSASSTYAAGDYVIYNDQLYKCTTAHTGAWDENNFAATTISDEITDVADAVDDIKDGTNIDSFADVETALADKVNKVDGKELSTNDYDDTEKAAVAAATSAISAMKDGTDIDSFGDVEIALLDKADTSDLGTAAAKDSTNAVTSGSTDLVESGAVKDAIDAAVAAAYHHAGTKTVAQLTHDLLVAANEGNVYNITDSGTTTSDFIEGIGKTIDEGSNVGICKVGNVYMFDLLSGFVDTTNFVQKSSTAGLLKNDGTVNDEIEGDVSTLKSGLTNLDTEVNGDATVYPYASSITIPDAIPANVADCTVKIEPVQDLHGYDHPWVGGAGKNKLPLTVDIAKSLNGGGTWTGNTYNFRDVDFTVNTDSNGNVTSVKVNGTASQNVTLLLEFVGTASTEYYIGGCPTNGGNNAFYFDTFGDGVARAADYGGGATFTADGNSQYVRIGVQQGYNAQNLMFYPMICLNSETDKTFAPYTNICPISGHTEASVQRDGKNLFDKDDAGIVVGKYLNSETGELVNSTNNWNTSDYIYVGGLGGESITFSGLNSIGASNFSVCYYDKNNSFISGLNGKVMTLTIPSDERIAYLRFDYRQVDADDIQLELGSSATDYEPYQGKTYTIALGDTIYGGTVDFDSGVMTVDRKYAEYTDGTGWQRASSDAGAWFFCYPTGCAANSINLITDKFVAAYAQTGVYNTAWIAFNQLHIKPDANIAPSGSTAEGLEEFKTWLSNNHLQAVYPLATPTTIQLTPQQIQLLKGTNTLTASTGDISVTVNGVSGAIGAVQEQVNEIAGDVDALTKTLVYESASTGTYSDKLQTIKTAFDSLSSARQSGAYIDIGGLIYHVTIPQYGMFSAVCYDGVNSEVRVQSIELSVNFKFNRMSISPNGNTFTDLLSTENTGTVKLYA